MMMVFFPVILVEAKKPAIGRPIIQETKRADREIFKDKKIISYRSLLKEKMSPNESDKTPT